MIIRKSIHPISISQYQLFHKQQERLLKRFLSSACLSLDEMFYTSSWLSLWFPTNCQELSLIPWMQWRAFPSEFSFAYTNTSPILIISILHGVFNTSIPPLRRLYSQLSYLPKIDLFLSVVQTLNLYRHPFWNRFHPTNVYPVNLSSAER